MEQLVRVVQVFPDGTAKVLRVRESACSGDCHKCSGCGAQQQTLQLTAENPIGARPGETVRLHSSTAAVLKAAAVVYLAPQERVHMKLQLTMVLRGRKKNG